jgi:NADPH:quinone reductase-like Zn-dependent oxidoreductase
MRANRVHRYGPPEVIDFEEVERPVPGSGEVLIRVQAAGVGPWDAWMRAGKGALPQPLPLTLGADVSGTVEATGDGVRDLRPGDGVFGVTNAHFTGGYAEYAVASAAMLAPKPERLSHVEAAAAPVVAVTALQMLFDRARVASGHTVLIQGAGGSVGACAVQLARRAGARVIATTLSSDVDYVRGLGAAMVIDSDEIAFEDAVDGVDVVIDTVGGAVQRKSLGMVKPGGVLVSSVSEPDPCEAEQRGIRASFLAVAVTTAHLLRLAALMDTGELGVRIGTVLPLAKASHAHKMLDGVRKRPPGKIVLRNREASGGTETH